MNTQVLNDFHSYLCRILTLYEDILPVIKQELKAIQTGDIASLNENLKVQQALLHGTRDFDEKVSDYIKKLNLEADNLSCFIQSIPEDRRMRFYTILGRFAAAVQDVTFYKDKCRLLLMARLHNIDKALSGKRSAAENRTYEIDATAESATLLKSFETTI